MDYTDMLPASSLKEKIASLKAVFAETDSRVSSFRDSVDRSCEFGCGTCCEEFIPDVSPTEAAYVACVLVATDKAKALSLCSEGLEPLAYPRGNIGCPLYSAANPYHCTIYEARPLICRMFGYSAMHDKYGNSIFSLCHQMADFKSMPGERKFGSLQEDARFPEKPPVMTSFGQEISLLDPDTAGRRELIHLAVPSAIARVLFLAEMRDNSSSAPEALQ